MFMRSLVATIYAISRLYHVTGTLVRKVMDNIKKGVEYMKNSLEHLRSLTKSEVPGITCDVQVIDSSKVAIVIKGASDVKSAQQGQPLSTGSDITIAEDEQKEVDLESEVESE